MICPVCSKQEKKSTCYPRDISATHEKWLPFYDENGKYHSHDPNYYDTRYFCSLGHEWTVREIHKCPCCDYGTQVIMIHAEKENKKKADKIKKEMGA